MTTREVQPAARVPAARRLVVALALALGGLGGCGGFDGDSGSASGGDGGGGGGGVVANPPAPVPSGNAFVAAVGAITATGNPDGLEPIDIGGVEVQNDDVADSEAVTIIGA